MNDLISWRSNTVDPTVNKVAQMTNNTCSINKVVNGFEGNGVQRCTAPITHDFNGDGINDFVTGAWTGGGPRVRVFSGASPGNVVLADFFAFEQSFTGGTSVGMVDLNGDGLADILVGAGPGGGPRVNVYYGPSSTAASSFYSYESTFPGGCMLGP